MDLSAVVSATVYSVQNIGQVVLAGDGMYVQSSSLDTRQKVVKKCLSCNMLESNELYLFYEVDTGMISPCRMRVGLCFPGHQ